MIHGSSTRAGRLRSARGIRMFVMAGLLLVLLSWTASAQTDLGSIVGTVTDESGAVVAGAEVQLTEIATGAQRTATTNAEGNYNFAGLPFGRYKVKVSAPGFKEVRSTEITLTTQQVVRFDAVLEVGEVTESIEVSTSPPTINTENAKLTYSLPREDLLNLPMNTRSTLAFLSLDSAYYSGRSAGGLRGNQMNYTIDGVTANAPAWGGAMGNLIEVALESIQEVKVMKSNNAAEYPRVATMYVTTRSGTNQLHGSAVYDHNNNAFNARNFFAPTKPKGPRRHEFGGSIGGPVYIPNVYDGHNKTFFYFTYEAQRAPGQRSNRANVPTLKMRAGDFSALLPKTVIKDPTTGQPFPGNSIPASRISPVANNIQNYRSSATKDFQEFIPKPNFGDPDLFSANFRYLRSSAWGTDRYVARVDHQMSKDTLTFRLVLRQAPTDQKYEDRIPTFQRRQQRNSRSAYISWTHIFSPTLVNEFRGGFGRDYSKLRGYHKGAEVLRDWGLLGVRIENKGHLTGLPRIQFVNFSRIRERGTTFWVNNSWDIIDNVTWTKSKHIIKAGILIRPNQPNIDENPQTDFGDFRFNGFASGFDYADFLLGIPITSSRYERAQPRYNRYKEIGAFIQDSWRITPKLTLNIGVRYEYFTPVVDKNDMRFAFDPSTGNLVLPNQKIIDTLVSPLFPKEIPLVTAQSVGLPERSLYFGDANNIAPRFGFAYRPFNDNRTVVRGGFGIYYNPMTWPTMDRFAGGPFVSDERFLNEINNGTPLFQFPEPFTERGTIPTQSVGALVWRPKTPNVMQWNLTIEREIGASVVASISYRGFRSNQLLFQGDINKPYPSDDPANRSWFRYENFYRVNMMQNGGIHKSHALDVRLERQFSQGLTFQAGWTWAKNLTDVPGSYEGGTIENPYDRRREMADQYGVNRHRFVGSFLWELPFGAGKRFGADLPAIVQYTLGNWQFSGAVLFSTGFFLNPGFSGADPSNTRTWGGRPDRIGDHKLSNANIDRWFNPGAFAVPPNGRFGNSARGVIVGPGIANFNFGLFKYFHVGERLRVQLRMTATNFFNHPNFGNPNTNISSGNVGRITRLMGGSSTLYAGSRNIRLGVRLDF